MTPIKYPIIFCGAGPGDPELITVKGQKALQSADLVLYAGSLVPKAVLSWSPASAERISSAGMDLTQITQTMIDAYADGKKVVRLHTGDPSLYGAIMEQMTILDAEKIPYDVIPGVTAAFAAAAALKIEYTVPEITQTLILTRMAGRTPVPERENLTALAEHRSSMVIYLSMALIEEVAETLIEAYGSDSPCAIAYRVSHPEEALFVTTLAELVSTAHTNKINRLAVIMVGSALEHPSGLKAFRSQLYHQEFSHGYRNS